MPVRFFTEREGQQSVDLMLLGLTKGYGRRQLFANITRTIGPGECLAVTGANGSGKSTLLKVIAGLIRPDAGAVGVCLGGRRLEAGRQAFCFGMVSPEIVFYQTMTGYENLRFITGARGFAAASGHLRECLHTAGLSGCAHELVSTYSTGMRQRLKFAVLAALKPPVWLLDEPLSNLDETGKVLVAGLVKTALNRGAIVVIATNEPEEAAYAGQTILLA